MMRLPIGLLRLGQCIFSVEDVEFLVFHGAYIEEIDRYHHVDI